MKKVLFLINTLGGGGAERVLVNLVNHMDPARYDITVETMFGDGVCRPLLAPHIRYISKKAPCFSGIAYVLRCIPARWLYRYFIGPQTYDVIIAYMHGAPTKVISGCKDPQVKKLTWLHLGDPAHSTFFHFWWTKRAAFSAYGGCDAIAAVCQSAADAFCKYTGLYENVKVVYNTNDTETIRKNAREEIAPAFPLPEAPLLCAVGRLSEEKGFDRLIDAAVRLHREGCAFCLVILGEGSARKALEKQIAQAGAASYIFLNGFTDNPYAWLARADLAVCSSRYEGLSTAVTEALIVGVPVLSTDVSGARELLGAHGEYGVVTPNSTEGIYDGLKSLLTRPERLSALRVSAAERGAQFETSKTVQQACDLIDAVCERP